MANQKNADPALVQKKLAVLNPQLKALEEQRAACEDPRKQKLLEKKIEKVHDKIRQAKTGERFSAQLYRVCHFHPGACDLCLCAGLLKLGRQQPHLLCRT